MQIAGIVVGILGVMVLIAPWEGLDLDQSLIAQFAILGATACYGFSLAYMRKFVSNSGMSALVFSFLNIGIAALIMLVLTPVVAVGDGRSTRGSSAASCYSDASAPASRTSGTRTPCARWGPTRASTVTYLTPVVGVALGLIVLGEPLTWNEPAGALVVFLGILLAQDRLRLRRRS